MPAALSPIFQGQMLDRAYQEQLSATNAFRKTAYRLPMPIRSGESMTYSRAGRIAPSLDDINPASNVILDNGAVPGGVGTINPAPFPFEQYSVGIGMQEGDAIDLNLIQNQEIIANLFAQNTDNLAEQAALQLDLRVIRTALRAYEGGQTFATTPGAAVTAMTVDNVYGFDTSFATGVFGKAGVSYPYGLPQTTSATYPSNAKFIPVSTGVAQPISIIAVAFDGVNSSSGNVNSLNYGASGTITLSAALTFAKGDVIIANDAQQVLRPNGKTSRFAMAPTDTMGAQMIINAVAALRRNGIKPPLANGTFPCYIDPVVDAQFFTDSQYQIMSQGQMESPDFKGARISRNFGVTFIPTTNLPAYSFTPAGGGTLVSRRVIVCGEKWVQESPFEGTKAAIAALPDMGVVDYRFVGDIVFTNRMPLDRAGQVMSSLWYYIGGFVIPTNATITSAVIPTATTARYKSAVVVEVASAS